MKAVRTLIVLGLLVSQVTLAQTTDYNALKAQSESQAQQLGALRAQEVANLVHEIDSLNLQIEGLKADMHDEKVDGVVSLVATSGLLVVTGLLVRHQMKMPNGSFAQIAGQLGTTMSAAITLVPIASGASNFYQLHIDAKDLVELQARLAAARSKLTKNNIQIPGK